LQHDQRHATTNHVLAMHAQLGLGCITAALEKRVCLPCHSFFIFFDQHCDMVAQQIPTLLSFMLGRYQALADIDIFTPGFSVAMMSALALLIVLFGLE
jgi:hypothetical protein